MKIGNKTTATIMLVAVGGMPISSKVAAARTGEITAPQFIMAATQSDAFEVEEGKLAEKMGSPALRRFGAKMVHDRTVTTEELHAAIRKAGMTVRPPPALRADQTKMMTKLQGLDEKAFDKLYVEQQVMSHREALELHEAYTKDAAPGPIKMAAAKAIPVVREHLHMIEIMAAGKPPAI